MRPTVNAYQFCRYASREAMGEKKGYAQYIKEPITRYLRSEHSKRDRASLVPLEVMKYHLKTERILHYLLQT